MTADAPREQTLRERLAALTPQQRAAFEARLGAPASVALERSANSDSDLPFPMTDIQQAYWAGRTGDFEFGKVATHSYSEIDAIDLDLVRLEAAWNRLVARHPMLRTVFLPDGTQQLLAEVPRYVISVEEGDPASIRTAMSHQVLPANRWPIFDIRATRIDRRITRIHLSFDAIVADISSRRILMREWGQFYRDPAAELPPLSATFRDFVLADAAEKSLPAHDRARDYWLARADTLPPAPELPLLEDYDRHAPPVFTRRSHRFDAGQYAALNGLARQAGVGLNALLLTAYADALRLWSANPAFTLNLTLFNRPPGEDQAAVIGDFTALTLLEIDAPNDAPFTARAYALQERLWRDLDHRKFSGVALLREIAHRRGSPAMMPVVFTSVLSPGGNDTAWLGQERWSVSQTPQVWIDLMAVAVDDGLVFHWNAVDALFPPGVMAAMFGAFVRLLDGLADGALGDAGWLEIARTLLPESGRAVCDAANATQGSEPTNLLHRWSHAALDRPAVISTTRTLTHGELAKLATSLAHRLRALGLKPGMLAAVVMAKGWEQIVAVLAILEAGGAYLPIDPDLPTARRHYLLADAGAAIVLTQTGLIDSLDWPEGITRIAVTAEDLAAPRLPPLEPAQTLSDLAYVIYTSGSTGQPKGVAIDHRGAANTIADINARFAVGPTDRVLALSALSFDLSVYDVFGVLAAGGAVVLPDPEGLRDPAHWADLIARHGVTLWNSVPALAELLAGAGRSLPSLRLALLSGDRIALALPNALRAVAPHARVISLGGATEASIWSIWHDTATTDPGLATIPYGKPMRNQRFHVLGAGLVPCPIWVPGELYIGGIGLARGYWGDPAKTEAAFVAHPETGERLYRTGDRGRYLPDGSIEFLGRDDNQVKLRGFRVELGEIEAALTTHPAIRDAVVVASGATSSERTLSAYAIAQPGNASPDLAAWLRERLPAYMIPSRIALIEAMPLTANGKIDRAALARIDAQTPEPAAPSGEVETEIAGVVRAGCRVPIPATDSNFLDLGLTSIDMIRIVNAIEAAFGYRPAIETLYASPTIGWLAECHAKWREGSMTARHGTPAPVPPAPTPPPLALPPAPDIAATRRSIRRFTLRPIPLADLSNLLAAAMPRDGHRAYGSASGLYPVQLYLFANPDRIAGLAAGAYCYDAEAHALQPLGGATLKRAAFAAHNSQIFDEAAFALFLVGDMDAITPHYGERALHLATIEAGLLTQTLELAAPTLGLGLCQIGSADAGAVLGLSGGQVLLHTLFGGDPDPSPVASIAPHPSEEARLQRLFDRVAGPGATPETLTPDQAILLDTLLAQAAADWPLPDGSDQPQAICIQHGGDRPPLFVIHGSGGRVLFLHTLARHLHPDQPLYGIEAAPCDSGEDCVQDYADAIRAVQPEGRYRIGGYSAGSLIAFAVATSLDAEFLLMLDPAPVPEGNTSPPADPHAKLARRLEMGMLAGVTPLSPEFPQIERVDRVLTRIANAFRPTPIAGRIHAIHGTRGPYISSPGTLAAWASLATRGMTQTAIDADHFEIVREPHAAAVARQIQSWLDAHDGSA